VTLQEDTPLSGSVLNSVLLSCQPVDPPHSSNKALKNEQDNNNNNEEGNGDDEQGSFLFLGF
jgi:hypothetical protein